MTLGLMIQRLFFVLAVISDGHEHRSSRGWQWSSDVPVRHFQPAIPSLARPRFIHESPHANISVRRGADALLHCKVAGMGDQTVSWYKRKRGQIQLLTFGFQTYHHSERFSLTFVQPYDWRLRIKDVKHKDAGIYECQVPTHPPLIRTVNLSVVVPSMRLLDDRGVPLKEKFYKTGSIIILICEVNNVPTKKTIHLQWHHGERRLNYDDPRGGVSVKTEIRGLSAKSWLRIGDSKSPDSGVYFCNVSGLQPIGGHIHVIQDEFPAAVQTGSRAVSVKLLPYVTVIATILYPLIMEFLPKR